MEKLKTLKRNIWINVEQSEMKYFDIYDNNVDVIVTFSNRSKWSATFFTYTNIATLRMKNEQTGECMHGAYFWTSDMIIIDNVSRERIETVIDYLIENDEFTTSFKRCEDVSIDQEELFEKGFFDR